MRSRRHSKTFVLTAYEPIEDDNGLATCGNSASVKLRDIFCGVFSSVKRAESCIKRMVKIRCEELEDGWTACKWFGFTLVEHWTDEALSEESKWPCSFRSFRSYLGDGSLNCFSDTDEACKKKFTGAKRASRFKPGDIAWVLRKGKAVPTLVEKEAMTVEEWKSTMKNGVAGDFTDDSGIDFPSDCNGHDHTFSPLLFPQSALDFKIPGTAKQSMKKSRDRWLKEGF